MSCTAFVELFDCFDLSFVARAVGAEEASPQFHFVKIEETEGGFLATATDGRRLHHARINGSAAPGISSGYWRVLKNKSVKIHAHETKTVLWLAKLDEFDLFPVDAVNWLLTFVQGGTDTTGRYNAGENAGLNWLIKDLPDGKGINPRFLKDLQPFNWEYKIFDSAKPVLFECGNKKALVMTINLGDKY